MPRDSGLRLLWWRLFMRRDHESTWSYDDDYEAHQDAVRVVGTWRYRDPAKRTDFMRSATSAAVCLKWRYDEAGAPVPVYKLLVTLEEDERRSMCFRIQQLDDQIRRLEHCSVRDLADEKRQRRVRWAYILIPEVRPALTCAIDSIERAHARDNACEDSAAEWAEAREAWLLVELVLLKVRTETYDLSSVWPFSLVASRHKRANGSPASSQRRPGRPPIDPRLTVDMVGAMWETEEDRPRSDGERAMLLSQKLGTKITPSAVRYRLMQWLNRTPQKNS
jgi:hypothetical protein